MCDNGMDLIEGLEASGFKPLIIDENTDFSKIDNPLERALTTLGFPKVVEDTRSDDEVLENFSVVEDGITYPIVLDKKGRPKTNANRNRTAGNNWEREIVLDLKRIGYFNATTSRNASKARDDEKVDIMNLNERQQGFLPFDIQAKNLSAVSGFDSFLREMKDNPNTVRVILLRKTTKAIKKFMTQGDFAIMYYKDWLYYAELERKYNELLKTQKLAQKHNKGFENPIHDYLEGDNDY